MFFYCNSLVIRNCFYSFGKTGRKVSTSIMSDRCKCAQHVTILNQQISVMRKEIKNLRQMIDGAVRAHRKQLNSLRSVLTSVDQEGARTSMTPLKTGETKGFSLEQGNIQTDPIGFISSCFSAKNGTPRQPTICGPSRATLQLRRGVFTNPDHALDGLEQYSHVWIIFLFHKNGHLSYKAKVKPPRLNGQRMGLYSTRSPHRPNALGLTLAKLNKVTGDTLHLSGIDMIAGTPVLDIKPYIPDYDSPQSSRYLSVEDSAIEPQCSDGQSEISPAKPAICGGLSEKEVERFNSDPGVGIEDAPSISETSPYGCPTRDKDRASLLEEVQNYVSQRGDFTNESVEEKTTLPECPRVEPCEYQRPQPSTQVCYGEELTATIASWIREPPVDRLAVRFTSHAERDLNQFQPPGKAVPGRPSFRFLRGPEEAAAAIRAVLSADPRSVYRRTCCPDKLFYLTLDTAHVTCWFGEDFAEVLRVRAAEQRPDL